MHLRRRSGCVKVMVRRSVRFVLWRCACGVGISFMKSIPQASRSRRVLLIAVPVLAVLCAVAVATWSAAQRRATVDASWPAFALTYRDVGVDRGMQRYRYTHINDSDWAFAILELPPPPELNGRIGPGPGSLITVENSRLTTIQTEPDPAGGAPRVTVSRNSGRGGFSDWSWPGFATRVSQQPGAVRYDGLPADASLAAGVAVPWPISDVVTVVTPEPGFCLQPAQRATTCAAESRPVSVHVFTKSHGILLQRYVVLDGRIQGGMFAESLRLR
jgi:hypothetical protein